MVEAKEELEVYTRPRFLSSLVSTTTPPSTLYSSLFLISTIVTSLLLLSLFIRYLKRTGKSQNLNPWPQLSNMEKATSKSSSVGVVSPSPPLASACDVLKPLSQTCNFPNSGAVAARAREEMQSPGNTSPATSAVATQPRCGSETKDSPAGSVQRRSESVQQMSETDADGVRTWRRLVVEYS